jgi:hypothetical protein
MGRALINLGAGRVSFKKKKSKKKKRISMKNEALES